MTAERKKRVLLVAGNDASGIEAEARRRLHEWCGPRPAPEAVEAYRDRDDRKAAEVMHDAIGAILSPPFLGGDKTVWLHLDSGFGDEEATGKGEKGALGAACRALAAAIRAGLPSSVNLILSGVQDKKAPLLLLPAAVLAAGGEVVPCDRPEFNSANWRRQMEQLVARRAAEKGMTLSVECQAYLVDSLGTDTGRMDAELEKVICYAGGPGRPVTLADLQAICRGDGEASDWSFLDAIRLRHPDRAWQEYNTRMAQEKTPDSLVLRLLGMMFRDFSQMLQILVFMQERKLRSPAEAAALAGRLSPEEKATCIRNGFTFLEMPAWLLKKATAGMGAYKGADLVRLIPLARDAYWACVSGAVTEKRLALENFLLQALDRQA